MCIIGGPTLHSPHSRSAGPCTASVGFLSTVPGSVRVKSVVVVSAEELILTVLVVTWQIRATPIPHIVHWRQIRALANKSVLQPVGRPALIMAVLSDAFLNSGMMSGRIEFRRFFPVIVRWTRQTRATHAQEGQEEIRSLETTHTGMNIPHSGWAASVCNRWMRFGCVARARLTSRIRLTSRTA